MKKGGAPDSLSRLDDGEAKRVEHARTRRVCGIVECQRKAQNDAAVTKRLRKGSIRCGLYPSVRAVAVRAFGMLVAVRFGEDDVECDGRGAHVPEARNQAADEVAPPRPLADPVQ